MLGLALCLLAGPGGLGAQVVARDTLPIVRDLKIEGNRHFSDEQIERAIATRESGCRSFVLTPLCWLGISAFVRQQRLDPRELRTDMARIRVFYFRRGYREAEVDTSLARDGDRVDVTFRVREGPPVTVRVLEVRGLEQVSNAAAVRSNLPLREGEPYSEVELSASREQMERRLGNRGYPDAVVLVEASIPRDDTLMSGAHVILDVVPGPRARIGSIDVEGTSEVDPDDVRRLLSFSSGDVYREDEIVRSQRSLYSMALFNYVNITRGPVSPDSTVDVRVQVAEASMRSVQVGLGVSTTECLQVQAGWAHRNFLGGTRRLELNASLSNIGTALLARQFPCKDAGVSLSEDAVSREPFNKVNWRLRADFNQPWFLGTENWLALGAFSERQSLPGIYARIANGGDIRLGREISRGTALVGTYRAGRDNLEEGSAGFLFCSNFGVCQPDDIATLSESRWLSWLAVNLARSRTDAVFNPTTGYRLSLEGEHASRFTGSEWAYYRAEGEFSWYQKLGSSQTVLALRLRGGLVRPIGAGLEGVELRAAGDPVTNPLKRQYAGGAYTVRGYAQNLLGPKVLLADPRGLNCDTEDVTPNNTWVCNPNTQGLDTTRVFPRPVGGENSVVANAELRFPLSPDRWSGVVFLDLGRVWTDGTGDALAWSPGLGVRYQSPVGPLRLDIGYNTGGPERVKVVSELQRPGRQPTIVQLGNENDEPFFFEYDPFDDTGLSGFISRLQLHFSIGQAF